MTVDITELTPQQHQALAANFTRAGTYFLSDDLHSMLDCASTWDVDRLPPLAATALPSGPLGFTADGILREEFFGGIYWDRKAHRQAMVDRTSFAILRGLASGRATASELSQTLRQRSIARRSMPRLPTCSPGGCSQPTRLDLPPVSFRPQI